MKRVSHSIDRVEVTFDEPNLVANAGLLLVGTLVARLEIERLVNSMVRLVGRVGGALPGRKVLTLVHTMVAGGSHIDHVDVLRSGNAAGRPVVVSRGELVEIGGGFRIPEIMALSGAELAEVGTTNRTRLADYRAVANAAALLLKVHASNYRIEGFTSSVDVAELAGLGPPVAVDLGSGLLNAACPWLPSGPPDWLRSEPAARQSLEAGAALVTFSGDKLLGGPQAGVVAGRADLVATCARHPLYRVARPGTLVLAALQEVALAYLERSAQRLPFWDMATTSVEALHERAEKLAAGLERVSPLACSSVAGGGALPGIEIPSWGVRLTGDHAAALRRCAPRPVIAVVRQDETVVDLRTVAAADDPALTAALAALVP